MGVAVQEDPCNCSFQCCVGGRVLPPFKAARKLGICCLLLAGNEWVVRSPSETLAIFDNIFVFIFFVCSLAYGPCRKDVDILSTEEQSEIAELCCLGWHGDY